MNLHPFTNMNEVFGFLYLLIETDDNKEDTLFVCDTMLKIYNNQNITPIQVQIQKEKYEHLSKTTLNTLKPCMKLIKKELSNKTTRSKPNIVNCLKCGFTLKQIREPVESIYYTLDGAKENLNQSLDCLRCKAVYNNYEFKVNFFSN